MAGLRNNKKMKFYAHRGASADFPEHTMAAYRGAIEQGALGFECDIRVTKDEVLILWHDANMKKEAKSAAIIANRTYAEIKQIYPAVMTLNELLDLAIENKKSLALETKHPVPTGNRVEELVVAELHKRKDAIKKSGIDVAIMSFSWFAIEKIKKMDPTIKTVMLLGDITNKITRRFTSAQVIGPSVEMIRKSPELISEIKNSGKELYVWTVDSTEDLQYCASVGVDIVMTNRPAHARSVMAVREGKADFALVPIENSVEGVVARTLDELAMGEPLVIAGEVTLPVSFSLMTKPGTQNIKRIATHPHAESQCRAFIAKNYPNAEIIPTASTAAAAEAISRGEFDAAIAAEVAAAHYGLEVIAKNIGDNNGAVTRFVLVSKPGALSAPTGHDRTSLALYIDIDHAGALLEILTEFAKRDVNLTFIQSRPTGRVLGDYHFIIDAEGHVNDPSVSQALEGLREICDEIRFLGSYPRESSK